MQPLLIINLTDGRGAVRHAAGAPPRTTLIIWPPSGLFPSLRLSLLLWAWWSTARVSIKHLGASACLIHSSPTVRPAVISFTHESPSLISQPPFWHTPPVKLLWRSLTYHIPHQQQIACMATGRCISAAGTHVNIYTLTSLCRLDSKSYYGLIEACECTHTHTG